GLCAAIVWIGRAAGQPDLSDPGARANATASRAKQMIRIAAAQPRNRTIDWKLEDAAEVLRRVDRSLGELEQILRRAAEAQCDALAFPEDTLGLLNWEAAHPDRLKE